MDMCTDMCIYIDIRADMCHMMSVRPLSASTDMISVDTCVQMEMHHRHELAHQAPYDVGAISASLTACPLRGYW